MADVFDKIASQFVQEKKHNPFQTEPLRMRYDYGERMASIPSFEEIDTDGDGVISPDEWDDAFDMVTDDEFISVDDLEDAPALFDDVDDDDDGVVSRGDWEEAFDDFDHDDDGFVSHNAFYGRNANSDFDSRMASDGLDDLDDLVDDIQDDLEDVEDFIDDLNEESEEATRFVEDFDSEVGMSKSARHRYARFSKGEKGRKEWEDWMDDQPQDFQDKWEEMNEEYGNTVKNLHKKASFRRHPRF